MAIVAQISECSGECVIRPAAVKYICRILDLEQACGYSTAIRVHTRTCPGFALCNTCVGRKQLPPCISTETDMKSQIYGAGGGGAASVARPPEPAETVGTTVFPDSC